MTETQIICKNCILPNGFLGIKLNPDRLCNFCSDTAYENPNMKRVQINEQKRKLCLDDWNEAVKVMQENRGTLQHDCVIGYSGGKDSTALVDTFVHEYKLNPLLITVDTGFMTDVAKKNIKDTLTKMNLYENHVLIEAAIPTFKKLYKYYFFNHDSNEKSLTVDICHSCTDLIHTIVVKEAMKRGLKLVVIGFSPDQIARYFYETSREETLKDGTPDNSLKATLEESDFKWYFNSSEVSLAKVPRVLYPYHVIDYDENEIINRVETKGLIEVGKADPTLTNCHVVKAALMYDFHRYGGITYALQYAELVRQQASEETHKVARKKWLRLYKGVANSILKGTFNIDGMNTFFDNIRVSKKELMDSIVKKRDKDPNKEQIIKNIELIRHKNFK